MDQGLLLWLVGQSFIIVGAVVVAHVATKVSIAHLQQQGKDTTERLKELKQDHKLLSSKVDGISRHVAKMEVVHDNCPYVSSKGV